MTAQMRRGEQECNRLIMWLVALGRTERENEEKETNTERQEEKG